MPYTIGENYTSAEIKSYPSAAAGPTATAGASAWAEGTLVEVVPINTIAANFSLLGLTAFIAPLGTADTRLEGVFNIYAGADLIASVPFDWYIDSALGHTMEQVIPIMPAKMVAANSQIRVAVASSLASSVFGGFKIQYVEALETYTTDPIKCYPYLAAGIQPQSTANAWEWGAWLQLVPVDTITSAFDICAINWLKPMAEGTVLDTRYEGVIQIGTGGVGAEVSIISLPVSFLIDTKAEHVPSKQISTLPVPRRVSANTRVAVRVTDSLAGVLTWGPVKIGYVSQPTQYDETGKAVPLLVGMDQSDVQQMDEPDGGVPVWAATGLSHSVDRQEIEKGQFTLIGMAGTDNWFARDSLGQDVLTQQGGISVLTAADVLRPAVVLVLTVGADVYVPGGGTQYDETGRALLLKALMGELDAAWFTTTAAGIPVAVLSDSFDNITGDETGRMVLPKVALGELDTAQFFTAPLGIPLIVPSGLSHNVARNETGRAMPVVTLTGGAETASFLSTALAVPVVVATTLSDRLAAEELGLLQTIAAESGGVDVALFSGSGRAQLVSVSTGGGALAQWAESCGQAVAAIMGSGSTLSGLEAGRSALIYVGTGGTDIYIPVGGPTVYDETGKAVAVYMVVDADLWLTYAQRAAYYVSMESGWPYVRSQRPS